MKVAILCGGYGTRIRDVSEILPKPMIPVGGKPILWHIMKTYAAHGVDEFVMCLGYKGWLIKEFFLNYRAMTSDLTVTLGKDASVTFEASPQDEAWKVILAETGEAAMTAARVTAARRYLEGDDVFCLTYGDGVADIDITALLRFHRAHGKIATVTAVRPPGRFGEMEIRAGKVEAFNEKPQTSGGFINGGFFVFDAKRVWPYLQGGQDLVLEQQPLRKLASDGELVAFEHTGFWQPMDTSREYTMLNDMWAQGRAPWKVW